MSMYDLVIWNTGELPTATVGPTAIAALTAYLDGGGALFFSSQGYLNHRGLNSLTTDYFGVSAFNPDTGANTGTGTVSDPIGDGLSFTLAPPYADDADDVTPGAGAAAWLSGPAGPIGVRYDSGTFKTVFMSAPFEGIPETGTWPNTTAGVMARILDWLLPTQLATDTGPVVAQSGEALFLEQNAPNPFRSSTSLRFSLPEEAPVTLTVFNVAGRKVAELMNRPLPAGPHAVTWDGRDAAGRAVASGVYLYRLQAGSDVATKEMVLTR
jgi:hypothetical protein